MTSLLILVCVALGYVLGMLTADNSIEHYFEYKKFLKQHELEQLKITQAYLKDKGDK